jgi:hypothetical protein
MNQKLSDWASIAEIISAVAIVVSLIFVGMEIRRNTEAEYLLSYDRLLAEMTNWRMTLATNPETYAEYELFVEAMEADDPESLDPTVRRTGRTVAIALVQIYERAYFARSYGRIGDAEWSRFQVVICNPDNQAMTNLMSRTVNRFSQQFVDYLSQCVRE